MQVSRSRPRPGILTVIGGLSLVWSIASPLCVGLAFLWFAISMTGTPSKINMNVQCFLLGWFVASPTLSLVLFFAAWTMLNDDPRTLKLNRSWARISLTIDALVLVVLGMANVPGQLFMPLGIVLIDLIYASIVLYAAGLTKVRAYFGDVSQPKPGDRESLDVEFF